MDLKIAGRKAIICASSKGLGKACALALAAELAAQPRLAVQAMLEALVDSEDKTLAELLAAERAAVHATMGTPDAEEGIRAFLETRPPVFNQAQ